MNRPCETRGITGASRNVDGASPEVAC
jgi:hypothetical protein